MSPFSDASDAARSGPGWVLRISVPLQLPWEAPLYDGVTIGRHQACSIIIREEGVCGIHATIERDGNKGLTICCEPNASLTLPDGSSFGELTLASGLTFQIGDCATCQVLHQPAAPPLPVMPMERRPPTPVSSATFSSANCPRCGTNLAALAAAARFCPRCGRERSRPCHVQTDVEPAVPASAIPSNPDEFFSYEPPDDGRPFHSVMLLGYGNAMTRLGQRYAAGFGVYRNDREALRCFFKAAQLGNEEAQQRLARRGLL